MANINDYQVDVVKHHDTVVATASNSLATATASAAVGRHNVFLKCEASFSSSTASALLEIKFGSTVKYSKYIHGAGAADAGVLGHENPDANEAISAELAAGGSGVTGAVTLTFYTTGARA